MHVRLLSFQSVIWLLVGWLLAGIGGGTEEQPQVTFHTVTDQEIISPQPVRHRVVLDPRFEAELREKKKPAQGLFETALTATHADGRVDLRFSFKNVSGETRRIVFGSGQMYDFWVYNGEQEEVYRWSSDKTFIQVLLEQELGAAEELVFQEQWDLKDSRGNPVPPGTYTVVVEVLAGLESGAVAGEDRTARTVVEIGKDGVRSWGTAPSAP
jgi:hypothetical protein